MPAGTIEPADSPAPTSLAEPTALPEAGEIDYTKDATCSLSFDSGYVELLREASVYESASAQDAYAKAGPGTAYAISRANAGRSNDRLQIAFATADGLKKGYVYSGHLRPMSTDEVAAYIGQGWASDSLFYEDGAKYPLSALPCEFLITATPEPAGFQLEKNNRQSGFQAVSFEEIITQYTFDLNSESLEHTDVMVDLTGLQDVTFLGILGLAEGADYDVSGTSIQVKTNYLSSQAAGDHLLTLAFSDDQQLTITVSVTDTTPVFNVSPAAAAYNLREGSPHNADITFTLAAVNTAFTGIQGLTEGSDYTVSDNTVTIRKDALNRMPLGENLLDFFFTAGGAITVTIHVYDGVNALTPPSAVYYQGVSEDVSVSMQLSGCVFTEIQGLAEEIEYTYDGGNAITLKQDYLQTLSPGSYELIFSLDCGDDLTLSLDVLNADPGIVLSPAESGFDKRAGSEQHGDMAIEMALGGNQFIGIQGFTAGEDFTVFPNTVTILSQTLESMENGSCRLYFLFDGYRYAPLDITIFDSTPMLYVADEPVSAGSGTGWSYVDNLLQITQSGLTVSGDSDTASIQVAASVTGLTISDLQLKSGSLTFQGGSADALALTLTGASSIHGRVLSGGILQISGTGSLDVTSTDGYAIRAGSITMLGGTVTATGQGTSMSNGQGISASQGLTILGGSVTAIGYAESSTGPTAGIFASSGDVTITGGSVTAIGYGSSVSYTSAYGIDADTITIDGGMVTARGYGASHGDGIRGTHNVTVRGGTVIASGETISSSKGFGIYSSSGSIMISGGSVKAKGSGTGGLGYGLSASAGIALSGAAQVLAAGDSAVFEQTAVTVNGQQANVSNWRGALYANGLLKRLQLPSTLIIGGEVHSASEFMEDIHADGWSWDSAAEQLILHGYNSSSIRLEGSAGLHLVLAEGSQNTVINSNGLAIAATSIFISGKGSLAAIGNGPNGCAIYASTGNIEIQDATVAVSSDNPNSWFEHGCGIFAAAGAVVIKSGSVTANTGRYGKGIYAASGGVTIYGGLVTVTGTYGIYAASGGVTILGGTIAAASKFYGIGIGADIGNVAIHGGNVTVSDSAGGNEYGIRVSTGKIIIAGGDVDVIGERGIYVSQGNIEIIGGSLSVNGVWTGEGLNEGIGIFANSGNILIGGGTVHAYGDDRSIYAKTGDITVSGGTVAAYGPGYRGLNADSGSVTISGGTVLACVTSAGAAYGIYGAAGIAISGAETSIKSSGNQAAFSKSTITVNGEPVSVSGMKQAAYLNGEITPLNMPTSLFIGGESYPIIDLLQKNISGNGWAWNCETSLLTLSGYDGGKIESAGPATLKIHLAGDTQNNVINQESSEAGIRANSVEIEGSGSLKVHGSFAGIYADERIAFAGTAAHIRAWGTNALAAQSITANGNPVSVTGSWKNAVYENGLLQKIDMPERLVIDEVAYDGDALFHDISGNGWTWNWENAQLTFNGYSGGYISGYWTASLHVVLKEGTRNQSSGIWVSGSIYISGSGSLETNALTASSIQISDSVVLTGQYYCPNGLTLQGSLLFIGSNHVYTLQSDSAISKNLILPSGNKYIIPAGRTVTIAQGASLTVNGELVNNGTIIGNIVAGNGNSSKIAFISLVPFSKTVYVNQSFTPAVAITPSYAANKQVTWTSSNAAVAMVASNGQVTGKKAGTAVIRATAKDGSGASGQCTVTVKQYVTQMNLSKTSVSVIPGKTFALTATALPADASDKQVTWSSSNTAVAKVSATGVVTGVSLGKATITATAKDGSNIKASCSVSVVPPVSGITLNLPKITIGAGQAVTTVTASVTASSTSNKALVWSSKDASVAVVDANGKITGMKMGTTTITATAADGSGKSASVAVTVVAKGMGVLGIKLSASSVTVHEKKTLTLNAVLTPLSPANKTVIWASSNTAVAAVSSSGVVTATKEGTATITAISSSGISAKCVIAVIPVPVSGVKMNKTSITVLAGVTYQLTAAVSPADAKIKTLVWSSSNPSIAAVSASGMVTAKGVGTATITAKSVNGITAACKVTVNPVKVSKITINTTKATITIGRGESLGKKIRLTPTITPSNATIRKLTWSSSNSSVAVVDQNGVVTSVGYGKANITATATDGSRKSAKCSITVNAVKVSALSVSGNPFMAVGGTQKLVLTVLPASALDKSVTWTSSNNRAITVNEQGSLTAVGPGKATITVTARDGSRKKATFKVTVK